MELLVSRLIDRVCRRPRGTAFPNPAAFSIQHSSFSIDPAPAAMKRLALLLPILALAAGARARRRPRHTMNETTEYTESSAPRTGNDR